MKKNLILLLILGLVNSCVKNVEVVFAIPTNLNFNFSFAETGEILLLNGEYFIDGENYTITFSNNAVATTTVINSNFLRIVVPQNAESGDVTLTYKNHTIPIEYIRIYQPHSAKLYAYIPHEKIVQINPRKGYDMDVLVNLENLGYGYFKSISYSKSTDELIGIQLGDQSLNLDSYYTRVKTSTGQVIKTILQKEYKELIVTIDGKLYGYIANDKIVELDIVDCSEIRDIADLSDGYFSNIVYSEPTDELIGIQLVGTDPYLTKIQVSTGQVNSFILPNVYKSLIVTGDGRLYGYIVNDGIYELNITNGSEIEFVFGISRGGYDSYADYFVHHEETNTLFFTWHGITNGNKNYPGFFCVADLQSYNWHTNLGFDNDFVESLIIAND